MSSRTAEREESRDLPELSWGYASRHLWQVPTFALGLAMVAGVAWMRPTWHDQENRHLVWELAQARRLLEDGAVRAEEAQRLAESALAKTERRPERAGEARYLAGRACTAQARALKGTATADWKWTEAREHLEEAERLGVPRSDQAKLGYELALAWLATGGDPSRAIEYLTRWIEEGADDRAEGYEQLAKAHLRGAAPDLRAALRASQKQLDQPDQGEEREASARLLQGELLLRLGEPARARAVLSRIGAGASAELQAQARILQARSCQDEHQWSEAARLWEEALADRRRVPEEPGRLLYNLGVCYRELGKTAEAARAWQAAQQHGGDEAQSAALALAELRLAAGQFADALASFRLALRDISTPEQFHNGLLDLAAVRNVCERGCRLLRESGEFDAAEELARLYEKVAPPGVAQALRAEVLDAAARAAAANRADDARARFREAAQSYLAVADATGEPNAKAAALRRAADRFIQAHEFDRARDTLQSYLATESAPERLGEGWLLLAQMHETEKNLPTAYAALKKCIEFPGPAAYRARFRLAQLDIEAGQLDQAEAVLKQNLELLRETPDAETQEKTLYALGALLYQRGNYRLAAVRLREAIERYPHNPRARATRLQLAESFRRLATLENQNLKIGERLTPDAQMHYREQYLGWLKQACDQYAKLVEELAPEQAKGGLTADDEQVLRQAEFTLGECRFDLGQYEDALRFYAGLAQRYQGQAEQLTALRQMWRCYWVLREPAKARDVATQVENALKTMDESAFRDPTAQSRQEWTEWVEWASKQ